MVSQLQVPRKVTLKREDRNSPNHFTTDTLSRVRRCINHCNIICTCIHDCETCVTSSNFSFLDSRRADWITCHCLTPALWLCLIPLALISRLGLLKANAFCCHSCPSPALSLALSLSPSSPLPAIQRLVCGKFLTHYTLCNVYTPAIMEAIDGWSEEWWMRQINNSCQY